MFCLDVKPILDVVIGNESSPSLLPLFFGMLEGENPLNARLAGYFNKVCYFLHYEKLVCHAVSCQLLLDFHAAMPSPFG